MASVPTLVSWNLTRRCNLACGHCYLDAVSRKSECGDELALADAVRVIGEIADLAPGAMVVLTGGEPLLRRDLDDIVSEAAGRGLMPVIGSNGILLTEDRAHRLRQAGAAGVGISLDGIRPEFHDRLRGHAGAWEGALAGMRNARAAGLPVLMQTTLFEENRHQLSGFADLAADVGAMALNFFFLVCTGRGVTQTDLSPQAFDETLRDILALQGARPNLMIRARCAPYARRMLGLHAGESRGTYVDGSSACLAGRSYLRIGPKGEVTPCPYIPNAEGSVRWQPLRTIWETGADFVRLCNEMPGGKCGGCDYRISCGGCRARALAMSGDLMAEDRKCSYFPSPSTRPEPLPARGVASIAWTPEAQRMLERIPGFVRSKVKGSLECKAAATGETSISIEFMREHRPSSLPFGRPGG
ncbi:MAG: radical SAM protein [Rhodocyclaceae bacterium]|nr:radical SAM protein [Rhodocyclaceae bacterium]